MKTLPSTEAMSDLHQGAQQFYFDEFGITNVWQQGLLNGAPYLCSLLIGCWLNAPLNKLLGRRGTIFVSCIISFAASFWMAAANNWYNLLIARFALGLAVGAKSSTTPVYSAESAPKNIRGALTMMWQMVRNQRIFMLQTWLTYIQVDRIRDHAWVCCISRIPGLEMAW